MAFRDWSSLPTELLLLVLRRLRAVDYVRFGAVCVSWNHIVSSNAFSPAPQPPCLLLTSRRTGHHGPVMFDPFTNKELCNIQLPHYNWYRGSTSDGYIMLQQGSKLLALNPLTGSRMNLPSLDTIEDSDGYGLNIKSITSYQRSNTVFAIHYIRKEERLQGLAFCKVGDDSWTKLRNNSLELHNILFYKQQLYGLIGDTGELCTFNLDKYSYWLKITSGTGVQYAARKYLVKSSNGDLLKINHNHGNLRDTVFKLDTQYNEWCRVRSLEDDAIMILDTLEAAQCICVSTREFPELRGNCIYSIKSYPEAGVVRHLRIFNVSDGSREDLDLPSCSDTDAYWFAPCVTASSMKL